MLLSIIIPVYNGEKKIGRCLDSLLQIKESDVEFIVVNDGSVDRTLLICEEYSQKDTRFRIINKEKGGVSSARNKGLECCNGKYVSFVDADDEIMSGYDRIIEIIRKEDYSLYGFSYLEKRTGQILRISRVLWNPGINSRQALLNNFLTHRSNNVWANIYRYDVITENNIKFPQNIKMGEDAIFNANFFQNCQEVYYIDEVGYKYYKDDLNSASYANKASYLKDYIAIHEKYMEIYSSDADLVYSFNGNYYLKNVFNVLKTDRKNLKKSDKEEFRNSDFFQALMGYEFDGWKRKLKKEIIRCYMILP